MRNLAFFAILLLIPSLSRASAPTCSELFEKPTFIEQIALLREEALAKKAAGDIALAKILYAQYFEKVNEARALGLPIEKLDLRSQSKRNNEEEERIRRARKREGPGALLWHPVMSLERQMGQSTDWSISPSGKDILYIDKNHSLYAESRDPQVASGVIARIPNRLSVFLHTVNWREGLATVSEYNRQGGYEYKIYSLKDGSTVHTLTDATLFLDPVHPRFLEFTSNTLKLRRISDGAVEHTWPQIYLGQAEDPIRFTPSGSHLIISEKSGDRVFDLKTLREVELNAPAGTYIDLSPNGEMVVFKTPDKVYFSPMNDLARKTELPDLKKADAPVLFDRDFEFAFTTRGHSILAYSVATGALLRTIELKKFVTSMELTADGRGLKFAARETASHPAYLTIYRSVNEAQ